MLQLGEQQRVLTGLGQLGEVVLHADLNMPAAGLNASAFLLSVGLAGLGYRHVTDQRGLTGRGELAEVFLDARLEPAFARLNLGAQLLDVRCAGLTGGSLLCYGASWRQQRQD